MGKFLVTKSKQTFSSIGIDHAHDQDNKFVDRDEGKSVSLLIQKSTSSSRYPERRKLVDAMY